MALTGQIDFRKTLTGKIVLRVEEEVPVFWSQSRETKVKRRWRDATLMDLAEPELRALMDLRRKPQYMARHVEVERAPAMSEDRTLPPAGGTVVLLQDPDS